ncbi:HHL181Cp [Eremothecium sinecaudum]|uniref:HHL181Cp n=1 Tax=Eremothecium sinecaudum TaxID=45286 RepID=A0A0X8HW32_9SACH|nr:HHL181Cp [Eremothecium sinecaudum]AMD22589.1 HHL181Cp [Eremothecium sinecaudum]
MFLSKLINVSRHAKRSITYLHSGARVRGLKRDPVEMLKNPMGLHYDKVEPAQYQDVVRKNFNLESYGLQLPDYVILQCLTHKSFAQGCKPYNEKLAILGGQFLKYRAAVTYMQLSTSVCKVNPKKIQEPVNGLNFANLGSVVAKSVLSKEVASEFVKSKNIDHLIFWNKRDINESAEFNGVHTIHSTVLNALIGSALTFHGHGKTIEYIEKELLDIKKEGSLAYLSNAGLAKN